MTLDEIIKSIGEEPYYIDGNPDNPRGVIYCQDCLRILPKIPDKAVDLVLTDPPYNANINYDVYKNDNRIDYPEWLGLLLTEFQRISLTTLLTGQNPIRFIPQSNRWKWLLCWHKPAAMGRSPVGFCNFEPIGMWGQGNKNAVDVITAPIIPTDSLEGHPCPKPLDWAKKQIALFPDYNFILDPFLGSGTTAVAAKQLGRFYIGVEISQKYCEIAVQRLQQEILL